MTVECNAVVVAREPRSDPRSATKHKMAAHARRGGGLLVRFSVYTDYGVCESQAELASYFVSTVPTTAVGTYRVLSSLQHTALAVVEHDITR